jgi:hypothetical protein
VPQATRTPSETAHRQTAETTFADIVKALLEMFGPGLVAFMAGDVERKTVTRWSEGGNARRESEERLRLAFQAMQLLLSRDSAHTVRAWFIGLNPQLDDTSPAQALHDDQLRDVLIAAKSFTLGG